MAANLDQHAGFTRTPRHIAIQAAAKLYGKNSLKRQLLEARLQAGESPEEIAQRTQLKPLVVEAYAALFFDTQGPCRFAAITSGKPEPRWLWQLGQYLKHVAAFEGADVLEALILLLRSLPGPTLTDGLPAQNTARFAIELQFRMPLLDALLPLKARVRKAAWECGEALIQKGLTEETVAAAIQVLGKARIPASLVRQLAKLRRQSGK